MKIIDLVSTYAGNVTDKAQVDQHWCAKIEALDVTDSTKAMLAIHSGNRVVRGIIDKLPVGGSFALLDYLQHRESGDYIDARYATPINHLTPEQVVERRDRPVVLCHPKNHNTSEDWGDGVSSVSFDSVKVAAQQLTGSMTLPQPCPIFGDVTLMHYRRPIEVLGHGLLMCDAPWEAFYQALIPAEFRAERPHPSLTA